MKVTKIKNATILNVDCMEYMKTLPDKFFDLAIVDPPYGIGMDGQIGSNKLAIAKKYLKKQWDKKPPDRDYFDCLFVISKNQIVWGANYYPSYFKASMGWIFWDKDASADFSDGELAYTSFDRALKKYNFAWMGMRQGNMKNKEERIHPTQKPVKLYEWILTNYAKTGQTIFDSHMGSGSSAIACNNLGFEYVGCELDEDYYEAACKRIAHHASQKRLFE